jgi:C-terminal processing protease CtpA/Prc
VGKVSLAVRRNGSLVEVEAERKRVELPATTLEGNTLTISSFGPGTAKAIRNALGEQKDVIIDLRRNPGGSLDEVKDSLAALAGGGVFAKLRLEPNGPLEEATIEGGKKSMRVAKILVGPGTAREAEVFAYGLRDLTGAPMEGGPTAGLGRKIQRFALPDGSGYSITAGHYHDISGKSLVREDKAALEARAKAQETLR